ncbi:MAG TPA: hypothetical protein VGX37_09885 [Allosphingosinicella sp.]|nr:hypothetical protein [Allosphingosinicella sp.]
MAVNRILAALIALGLASGCAAGGGGFGPGGYSLVRPGPESVAGGRMTVTPTVAWNHARRTYHDIRREENWTLNGPLLDNISFIGGLESGKAIVRQRRRAERQVPRFRAEMSPPELASMIETFFRVRAGSVEFNMTGLQPRQFLGRPGFQFDYTHLDSDEVERQGRAVGAVIDNRFYLILFDAVRMHYYPAGIGEFERIAESARLG